MADNIAINKEGVSSYMGVRELPWHKLGVTLENAPTSEEAIKHAGLDFEVGKAELSAQIPSNIVTMRAGRQEPVHGKFATYRKDTDTVLGTVGKGYTPLQNVEAFSFFDNIVGQGQAIYETAGALGDGETIWILAKLPDYISVRGDDIGKYLLLINTHDGSRSVQALFTPVRVVCQNTLQIALGQKSNRVAIRHSKSVYDKLEESAKVLGIVNKISDEMGEVFGEMASTCYSEKNKKLYVEALFPGTKDENGEDSSKIINIREKVYAYIEEGPGQQLASASGTVWGLYNGITGYFQNVKKYSSVESQAESNTFGANASVMQKALNLAMELTYN